ncbi:hypothetical protein H632_c235p1 [Helicosporidium sp. ATCC 50920]|nr:hypothetical protein H632_c235p1 [Helicosporidium sp. ATCC 50920]|eukprot:KDD76410.1 hypothetical protein H632_c235p1 [Helicosporidium sp. ATCC 50920]
MDQVLSRCQARAFDPESLELSAKLLTLSPEVYTVWNYRRLALESVLAQGGAEAQHACESELAVTHAALMRNPKSYSTWHHRRWVVGKGMVSLERELGLVGQLLDVDDRNFHAWGYRLFIAKRMGMPLERELEYTRVRIDRNFSNYSAWHSRSRLLVALHCGGGEQEESAALAEPARVAASTAAPLPPAVLEEEYELVKQAFYTEPLDQSGWMYHRWLLACSAERWAKARGSAAEEAEAAALERTLDREDAVCSELLEEEPEARWALLAHTWVRQLRSELNGADLEDRSAFERLSELDPLRRGFYADAAQGRVCLVQESGRGRAG